MIRRDGLLFSLSIPIKIKTAVQLKLVPSPLAGISTGLRPAVNAIETGRG
jgi:hypothetical protein